MYILVCDFIPVYVSCIQNRREFVDSTTVEINEERAGSLNPGSVAGVPSTSIIEPHSPRVSPRTHQIEIGDWEDSLQFLSLASIHYTLQNEGDTLGNVLIKQLDEFLSVTLAW